MDDKKIEDVVDNVNKRMSKIQFPGRLWIMGILSFFQILIL